MDYAIRIAADRDAEIIAPLFDAYRQFYGKKPDPANALAFIRERLQRSESVILLAEEESGRALMNAAREHAIKTGAKRLTLETMEDNERAWKLYESLGYVKSGPEVRYYTLELE